VAVAEGEAAEEAVAEADEVADAELEEDGAAVPVWEAVTVAAAVPVPVPLTLAVPDALGVADPRELRVFDLSAVRLAAGVEDAVRVRLADADTGAVEELVAVDEPEADGDEVAETELRRR
jgi:hypothetical protein